MFVCFCFSLFLEEEEWDDADQILKILNCPMMVAKKEIKVYAMLSPMPIEHTGG